MQARVLHHGCVSDTAPSEGRYQYGQPPSAHTPRAARWQACTVPYARHCQPSRLRFARQTAHPSTRAVSLAARCGSSGAQLSTATASCSWAGTATAARQRFASVWHWLLTSRRRASACTRCCSAHRLSASSPGSGCIGVAQPRVQYPQPFQPPTPHRGHRVTVRLAAVRSAFAARY